MLISGTDSGLKKSWFNASTSSLELNPVHNPVLLGLTAASVVANVTLPHRGIGRMLAVELPGLEGHGWGRQDGPGRGYC